MTTGMPSAALIALNSVSRDFDNGRVSAVRDVTLSIDRGESVAVVGASGSGKTTLLMLMCGILTPTRGSVLWDGAEMRSAGEWTRLRRTQIGIVFQDFNLFPTLTALENVEIATFGTGITAKESTRLAEAALALVGLEKRMTHLPSALSGGERQRVAIARSIVNHPAAIFADEPTGNLDSTNGAAIMDLLWTLQRNSGTTLVLVTHNAGHAANCGRKIEISDGRILPHGRVRRAAE